MKDETVEQNANQTEQNNTIETISKLNNIIELTKKDDSIISELLFENTKLHGDMEQLKSLFSDYAKYFGEVTNPKNTKLNPFHKAKYAPLDEVMNTVRPIMSKYGFSLIQIPTSEDGMVTVNSLLVHKSGAYIEIEGLTLKPNKLDAQGVGGAITYGRRYSASSIAGIMSEEDDDGNSLSGNKNTENEKKPKPKTKLEVEIDKIISLGKELAKIDLREEAIDIIGNNGKARSITNIDEAKKIKVKLEELKKNNVKK